MRALIWLSFDLGIRGDFEGMYQFLGEHNARECGDSMASFWFETLRSNSSHSGTVSTFFAFVMPRALP